MLYNLFKFLEHYDIPGARLFGYVSFRGLLAIVIALLVSTIFGEYFIKLLKRKQISETLRDLDKTNLKVGVPTMGGLIIIAAVLVPCILVGNFGNVYMILLVITTIWLGITGFIDDYIKTFKKKKAGMPGRYKIMSQVGLGLVIGLTLYLSPQVVMRENVSVAKVGNVEVISHKDKAEKSTKTTIPFIKGHNLDYADLVGFLGRYAQAGGWILFVIMTILIVTAVSNGANLNDGMDGMLAGNAAIIGVTLGIFAYLSSHINMAGYLNIMFIPGSEEVVVFSFAFVGALIGFLWYNSFPAQVFMGDTGSLTIGGIIAVIAILIHKEILLVILCGIFVAEALSVICQVVYFKKGKRKGVTQRIFKCTPLHHHFSITNDKMDPKSSYLITRPLSPTHEAKITVRFWIITIILAAITLITLKVR